MPEEASVADKSYNNPGSTLVGAFHSGVGGAGMAQNEEVKRGHLAFVNANIYQAAVLNKLLPPRFKIDFVENVQKAYETKLAA
jgi:hypothetical protein